MERDEGVPPNDGSATVLYLLLGMVIDRGPRLDYAEDEATVLNALSRQKFKILIADAGYESERLHEFCREQLNIKSIIPTTQRGRPREDGKSKAVTGHYRKLMQKNFPKKLYGQRWQIETAFSMLKRNLGCALGARCHHSQTREIRLRILTHNLMILRRLIYVLYRAGRLPIKNLGASHRFLNTFFSFFHACEKQDHQFLKKTHGVALASVM